MSGRWPAGLRALSWGMAAYVGGVLLHIDRIPWWITLIALAGLGTRIVLALRGAGLPNRWIRAALALGLAFCVLASFRTLNGLAAGSALLVAMGAVKLLETRERRDDFVMLAVSLFLLLAACLDRQDLLRMPLYLAHALLLAAALAVIATPQAYPGVRRPLRMAGTALLYALPLALLLFVFFPRLPGAFWALPSGSSAITGLSDEMSPGTIDALTEWDSPAFRIAYEGDAPPPAERYFRGPVLDSFDGTTWRRDTARSWALEPGVEFLGPEYRYRITLEPHGRHWWFALESVVRSPDPKVRLTQDRRLVAPHPVNEVVAYDAVSHLRIRARGPLSATSRRYNLTLPRDRNPRTLGLASELRAKTDSDADYAKAALDHIANGGFEYTLTPPLLEANAVDDFLFNTRQGFCGHFASAYTVLMRAGGVPARVVTGYLGGEWNPIGRFFVVKQSDAHAWVEIWLDGRGWTRVDPTGVVAPERLQRGLYDLLPGAAPFVERLQRESALVARLALRWAAVNAAWRDRVLEFSQDSQLALLERLGVDSPGWRHLAFGFAAGLIGWLAWVGWQARSAWARTRPDPVARAWLRLSRALERSGLARRPAEAPLAWAERVAQARPDLESGIRALAAQYVALRYQGEPRGSNATSAFASAVRRFATGTRSPQ